MSDFSDKELSTEARKSLSKETFGLPAERKYPMPDRSHAANAKARATQQYNAGNLSESQRNQINAKANRMLNADMCTDAQKILDRMHGK